MLRNSSNLTVKSIKGVAWTTFGYGFSQVLRLGSNLILTRLLAPEYFGIMAIVTVVMIGLNMFSDIGLGPNIIQSPRSGEPNFLNAAWTMQILRGVLLFVICVAAGFPLSVFYNEPQMLWLVPAMGLGGLIGSFNSTNIYTNNRDLNMTRITLIDLVAQVVSLGAMVVWALVAPSVWVLVVGSLVSAVVKLLASHWALPGIKNKFYWDTKTMLELVHFAKWIFLSTLLAFASNSTASLILGKFVTMAEVGVFSIAATLAKSVEGVMDQISQKVLLPVYNLIKTLPLTELRKRVKKIRLGVMGLFLPAIWILVLFADTIIQVLFDGRYANAGWIMRVYALGLIPPVISGVGPFYLALGNSKLMMKLSGLKFVFYIASLVAGWYLYQTTGLIVGMACYTLWVYVADLLVQRKYGIWIGLLDLLGFLSSGIVIGGVYWLWGFH